MEKTQVVKKVGKVTINVLLYLFIALCIFGVVLTIISKKEPDGTATVLGKQMRVVLSSSMEECDETDVSKFRIKDIPTGSMVFIDAVPKDEEEAEKWYSKLKIGDILTFKYVYVKHPQSRDGPCAHRAQDIRHLQDHGQAHPARASFESAARHGDHRGQGGSSIAAAQVAVWHKLTARPFKRMVGLFVCW